MPVTLFQHIIYQNCDSSNFEYLNNQDMMNCGFSYYVVSSAENKPECLAFNDGIPTIAFLPATTDYIELTGADFSYKIESAWLSTRLLENVKIRLVSDGGQLLIIRFNPVMFYNVFPLKAKELKAKHVWGLDEIGAAFKALKEFVEAKDLISEKVGVIRDFVLNHTNGERFSNYLFEETLSLIKEKKGLISVQELLTCVNVNYKWLERIFNSNLGISPIEYLRLQRFIHAYSQIINESSSSMISIATENGYYDQSHFIKEFKRFAGKSPLAYLK